jgi:flagellar biosynthesis/type III secretory pathway M-ring protein FliF/YscJ
MNTADPTQVIYIILSAIGFVLLVSWAFLPWLLMSRLRRMHETLTAIQRQGTHAQTAAQKADRELLGF